MKHLIYLLTLLLAISACDTQMGKKVGVLLPTMEHEIHKQGNKYMKQRAAEFEIEIAVLDAQGNEDIQFDQALQLINDGVKVLVLCSVNANLAAGIVREAHKKGVKVIAYDVLIKNSELDYYVSHNNEGVGELMAKYTLSDNNRNYMILNGDRANQNAVFVNNGIMKVLQPSIESSKIKIIYESYIENWSATEAYQEMEHFLKFSKEKPDVIIAASDDISVGVVKCLEENKLAGSIIVTGQNANIASVRDIIKGSQSMTIYKSIKDLAFESIDLANQLLKNDEPKVSHYINNGKKDVPSVLIPTQIIDKKNIELLIKEGMYTKEELYN